MNEFVFVEFVFPGEFAVRGADELRNLPAGEFVLISSDIEWDGEQDITMPVTFQRISGKIKSDTATALTLSNVFLAQYMHISYISNSLKNKFRL